MKYILTKIIFQTPNDLGVFFLLNRKDKNLIRTTYVVQIMAYAIRQKM